VFNLLLWCAVAITLLVANRGFWTSPAPDAARRPVEPDRPSIRHAAASRSR
jgi:hypothetical protein